MADENKIVTPSDIEEAKTETVDTQTTGYSGKHCSRER